MKEFDGSTEGARLEEDRAWLEAFRRGEAAALERVYRGYVGLVVHVIGQGFAFRSGGRDCRFHGARTRFELEDRVQDVFARAFTEAAREGYDGLTPYQAYLTRIAKNLVIDDFRRKERTMVSFSWSLPERAADGAPERPSEPLGGLFTPSGNPEEDVRRAELDREVRAVVETLPARERDVYRYRFVEEREHTEVAARTGLSLSQVKTSEARIRRAFFRRLRDRDYLEGYRETKSGWLRLWRGKAVGP